MNSLDQAFIRAFSKDQKPAGSATTLPPSPHEPNLTQAGKTNARSAPGNTSDEQRIVRFHDPPEYDATLATVSAPHVDFGAQPLTPWIELEPAAPVEEPQAAHTKEPPHIVCATAVDEIDSLGCVSLVMSDPEVAATAATVSTTEQLNEQEVPGQEVIAEPQEPADEAGSATPQQAGRSAPAWEVDRFTWPDLCHRLIEQLPELSQMGRDLADTNAQGMRVLAITGVHRGEGRTLMASLVARCAAQAGVRVALVDADTANPQLAARLGVDTLCSWDQVVAGDEPLHEATVASLDEPVSLLPLATGTEPIDWSDLKVQQMLRGLSEDHDLVIVDLPPCNGWVSSLIEAGQTCPFDAALVVRDVRSNTSDKVAETVGQLSAAGIGAVGIAENFGTETS